MPSCRKPASSVIRLRRLRTNSSAPTTSTSDSATCATTSARRRPKRSRVSVEPRLPAFIAAPGAVPVARIAGTRPNSRQVATGERRGEREHAPVERQRRRTTRLSSVVEEATRKRLSHCASTAPPPAPIAAMQHALREQLPDDAAARRADRQAHGDLALARGRARQHQVRQVRAGDQQHQPGGREQQPQRRLVVAAQRRDAGAGRERAELERQIALRVLGAVARRQRRLEDRRRDRGELRRRPLERPARLQPADRGEEPDVRLVEPGARAARQRLGAQRHRDVEAAPDLDAEETAPA